MQIEMVPLPAPSQNKRTLSLLVIGSHYPIFINAKLNHLSYLLTIYLIALETNLISYFFKDKHF